MKKSLLEQLPQIVAEGKRRAEQILEGLDGRYKVRLQTNRIKGVEGVGVIFKPRFS